MSYALQMQQVAVRVATLAGSELRGQLFLHAAADRGGPQTIGARLAAEGARFLPLNIDGRVELLRAEWIAYLEVAGATSEIAELEEIGASRAAVELELVTGEILHGDLLYLLPPGSNRVSDLLNAPTPDFLLLAGDGHTRYVRRDALARVRT